MKNTIGFIGGGNMAQAMINGLLESGLCASSIMVSDPNDDIRTMLNAKGIGTTTDIKELIAFADAIVLAIKPQMFETALSPLKNAFGDALIISVAAGKSIKTIKSLIGSQKVIRAMPNTPALIQAGATGLYAGKNISDSDKLLAENILKGTGLVMWLDNEEDIHVIIAVSGSAPAYFFYIMESMIEMGKKLGLSDEQATQLTLQTAYGASKMALSSDDSPTILREKVTSPNGTTFEAIQSFNESDLEAVIAKGMQAAVDRSKEMENEKT